MIAVIMPVRNQEKFILAAVHSILKQTYKKFQLIVIDDASTDQTVPLLQTIHDSRLIVHQNTVSKGVAHAMNIGLSLVDTPFAARMDGDDIAHPKRLELQLEFLEKNKNIGVVGSAIQCFGEIFPKRTVPYPKTHAEALARLIFNSCFAQPSVMMRMALFKKLNLQYNSDYQIAEDYDLWIRASENLQFANMPQVFLNYRIHKKQLSNSIRFSDNSTIQNLRAKMLSRFHVPFSEDDLSLHDWLNSSRIYPRAPYTPEQLVQWCETLVHSIHDLEIQNFVKIEIGNCLHRGYYLNLFRNRGFAKTLKSSPYFKSGRTSLQKKLFFAFFAV